MQGRDAETRAGGAQRQLVVFSLAGEEYALPIAQVQEIIRYQEPRSVAASSPWLRGVISLRGKIIAVCDLAVRLGLSGDGRNGKEGKNIVIVEAEEGTAGVVVDEVEEVLTVAEGQLDPPPEAAGDVIEAVVRVDDRLVILLDAGAIFSGLRLAA